MDCAFKFNVCNFKKFIHSSTCFFLLKGPLRKLQKSNLLLGIQFFLKLPWICLSSPNLLGDFMLLSSYQNSEWVLACTEKLQSNWSLAECTPGRWHFSKAHFKDMKDAFPLLLMLAFVSKFELKVADSVSCSISCLFQGSEDTPAPGWQRKSSLAGTLAHSAHCKNPVQWTGKTK